MENGETGNQSDYQVIYKKECLPRKFIPLGKESPSYSTVKQEGQRALNRSPEFCFKLTYRYLLKAGLVPGDTWAWANFDTRGKFQQTW